LRNDVSAGLIRPGRIFVHPIKITDIASVSVIGDDYALFAAFDAAATPTRRATNTNISAIVVALVTIAAETTAMKPSVASISMIAIAMTYPRIGRTVSKSPMLFHP